MSNELSGPLVELDAALTRLRRLWEMPTLRRRLIALVGPDADLALIRTLRAIELVGVSEPGVGDVAEVLRVEDSTASRLVEQAVTAGAIERDTSTRDRRRSVLRLTAHGTEVLRAAVRARTTVLAEATDDWDPDDVATLTRLLDRFTTALIDPECRS